MPQTAIVKKTLEEKEKKKEKKKKKKKKEAVAPRLQPMQQLHPQRHLPHVYSILILPILLMILMFATPLQPN